MPADPADPADLVLGRVLARPPTLGAGRLVCVDGPAGSGKTTLADALCDRVRGSGALIGVDDVEVVHMDDVYAGWAGLRSGMDAVTAGVVAPLRTGEPGRYRRFDWHRMAHAEVRLVQPCGLLILEGVGSGASAYADAITCLVWVDAPSDVRLSRAVARDGEQLRAHWSAWRLQEEAMFTREGTRERADVLVDGTTGSVLSAR